LFDIKKKTDDISPTQYATKYPKLKLPSFIELADFSLKIHTYGEYQRISRLLELGLRSELLENQPSVS